MVTEGCGSDGAEITHTIEEVPRYLTNIVVLDSVHYTTVSPTIVPTRNHSLQTETNRSTFKFIDLFAGIGGMRIAFEDAGGECVFSSEWDRSPEIRPIDSERFI